MLALFNLQGGDYIYVLYIDIMDEYIVKMASLFCQFLCHVAYSIVYIDIVNEYIVEMAKVFFASYYVVLLTLQFNMLLTTMVAPHGSHP